MAGRLKGKVAIVTGGASGMGKSTVELFLEEGAKVVAADVTDHLGEEMTQILGPDFLYIHTDVSVEADMKHLVNETVKKFGRLDCMFNNAGYVGARGELFQIDMDEFDETVGVLLKGVFLGYKYAVPVMKVQGSGSIISTASVAGLQAGFGPQPYSACKAAVAHLARTAALELGPHNIRSNAICPGGIATSIFGSAMGLGSQVADKFGEFIKPRLAKIQPIPKAGLGRHIAETALFLASDASEFVTGQAIAVDGGLTSGPMHGIGASLNMEEAVAEFMNSVQGAEQS